jgi:hypothetical protein
VTLETVPVATTGTYEIHISDAGGALGTYNIQAYLNTYLKQGGSNVSIGTALDLSSSSYLLGPGNADRLAVLYDAPGGNSKSHMNRDLGLAWLELPLTPPAVPDSIVA